MDSPRLKMLIDAAALLNVPSSLLESDSLSETLNEQTHSTITADNQFVSHEQTGTTFSIKQQYSSYEKTETTLSAEHPSIPVFYDSCSFNETTNLFDFTGTTQSAFEQSRIRNTFDEPCKISAYQECIAAPSYPANSSEIVHVLTDPSHRSMELPRKLNILRQSRDKLNLPIPAQINFNYSDENVCLTRNTPDLFELQLKRSYMQPKCNIALNNHKLSQTLPENSANFRPSTENLLIQRLPSSNFLQRSLNQSGSSSRKISNVSQVSVGGNLLLSKKTELHNRNESSSSRFSYESYASKGGNLLLSRRSEYPNQSESSCGRVINVRAGKNVLMRNATEKVKSESNDEPIKPYSLSQKEDFNLSVASITNNLSFRAVVCSTPKRLKVNENTDAMKKESISEGKIDNHFHNDPSDPEYVLDFYAEDEDTNIEAIDDTGMEIIIGNANYLTKFEVDEYFEKYRNRTLISEDEQEDVQMSNQNIVYKAEAIDDLGFEDLEKHDCRRKKKRMPLWQINKYAKECGQQYTKTNGTLIPARQIKGPCQCHFLRCYEKYTNAIREQLLSNLLKLTSSGQNQFISNHISVSETARPTVVNSRRIYTRNYFLPGTNGRVRVCKKMFLSTLDITDKKTRILAQKIILNNGVSYDDRRVDNSGKHIPSEHLKFIEEHIQSFPAYTSHYGREKSTKMYLSSDLSVAKLFRMYEQKCKDKGLAPVCYNSYRIIFRSFKLAFRRPSKDICPDCDKFKVHLKASKLDPDEKLKLLALRDEHQQQADSMYNEKKKDVNEAKYIEGVRTVSFDLQKCLPTPHLLCGMAYYCRQLYTLNLTLFSTQGKHNQADCFIWDETKAKRGSQEVGSCLLKDLRSVDSSIKELNYYSDRCSGQNLNYIICMAFLVFIEECSSVGREMTIRHKLMVPGHSHMEVDSVHASIEKAKKRAWLIFN